MYKESSRIELKESITSTYLKTISAFANYDGGIIYFGISDDGEILGLDNLPGVVLNIENTINDTILPRPDYRLSTEIIENKQIIKLEVFASDSKPYYYKHYAYQRFDTATVKVDTQELTRLSLSGSNRSYDELEVDDNNLEFSVLENKLKEVVEITEFNDNILRTLGLMNGGTYNKGAVLFADKSDFQFGIDIVKFGATESIFEARNQAVKVSLLTQYDEALAEFDKWFSPYEEVTNGERVTRVKIPRDAYREAVANAITHRDYLISSDIQIRMYGDRIKITSPGALPSGLSRENFLAGDVSSIRNNVIASILHRLKIIEKFGTGIKRINSQYAKFIEQPIFDLTGNYLSITLPVISYGTPNAADKIVYELRNGALGIRELELATGFSKMKLRKQLADLLSADRISREGRSVATKYRLK
jgi:ATP-dependent DNA helicase RecG